LLEANIVLKDGKGSQKKVSEVKELTQGNVIKLFLDDKTVSECN
jgi:hypothetical protein